jgi:hypothetical protein
MIILSYRTSQQASPSLESLSKYQAATQPCRTPSLHSHVEEQRDGESAWSSAFTPRCRMRFVGIRHYHSITILVPNCQLFFVGLAFSSC